MADTGPRTLKGARIKRIEKYIEGDTFLLTYGDGVADIDINELIRFHKSHGKIATLTGVSMAQRFGELHTDGDSVKAFQEKPEHATGGLINGGYFVLNREIFDHLTTDEECDFEYGPLERLAEQGELMVHRHDGYWACMDTLRDT